MFIGHFALGFAARRAAPRVALPVLFLAAQLADVVWPILVLAGLETVRVAPGITVVTPLDFVSYPYSHSLLALTIMGAVLGGVCARVFGGRTTFLVVAGLVVSHWVLDVVSHRPDMPLYPGSAKYGLSLWNSLPATLVVEFVMFGAGVWIYAAATEARDRIGRWSFVAMTAFLVAVYGGNLAGGAPPSINAIAGAGIGGAAFILWWSWWTDRHRAMRSMRG